MTDRVEEFGHVPQGGVPPWRRLLVVVAHPDDESFGLGAVIDRFVQGGTSVLVLCFTRGEGSTLGAEGPDLSVRRRAELAQAGRLLGVADVELLEYPDGALASVPRQTLVDIVAQAIEASGAEGLLVFDDNGVTGHPDHVAATRAAVDAGRRLGLPVLAWALPADVAGRLHAELGVTMGGRLPGELDFWLSCPREAQLAAVHAHVSQAVPASPLWRRLQLLGDREWLRFLVDGADAQNSRAGATPTSGPTDTHGV